MADQYDLYGGMPPHQHRDTSIAAAREIESKAETLRAKVLHYITGRGGLGATDDDIERVLKMRHQTASARRRELVLLGLIKDCGMRRKTSSGRFATVWVTA